MKPDKNSGSRFSDGNVPNVNFNPNNGKVNVNRCSPADADDGLRSREKFPKEEVPKQSGFLYEYLGLLT